MITWDSLYDINFCNLCVMTIIGQHFHSYANKETHYMKLLSYRNELNNSFKRFKHSHQANQENTMENPRRQIKRPRLYK